MLDAARPTVVARFADAELGFCRWANRACHFRAVRAVFAAVSRLGDGVAWYGLMAVLPAVFGPGAVLASAHMLGVAVTGLVVYRLLKSRTARARPCAASTAIRLGAAPLDRYSFPSGHTLHAVAFTVVALAYYPQLAPALVPFTAAVAASRVVLGLHYPTDVASGAGIGFVLASVSLYI